MDCPYWGSVSDLLDFQRFSDSRKCSFSSNPLRSTKEKKAAFWLSFFYPEQMSSPIPDN